jgi:TonB family protein
MAAIPGYAVTMVLVYLIFAESAWAEERSVDRQPVDMELFSGPRAKDLVQPKYPRGRQYQDREGWAQLNLMIDADGRPYEVTVVDSTGDQAFEDASIEAIEASTFVPAHFNGKSVDAGHNVKVTFALRGGQSGARPSFTSAYQRLTKAIAEGDRQAADTIFEDVDVVNLYEDAHYYLAEYLYHSRWGDPSKQLASLTRAIAHEQDAAYLPREFFVRALLAKFALQVQLQHFGAALHTSKLLKPLVLEADQRQALEASVAEIRRLQQDGRVFAVRGRIDRGTSWYFVLLKRQFHIDEVRGEIAELKLRCDRDYVFFRYDPGMRYQTAEHSGACRLEVVGDPETSFRLVQG